MATRKPVDPRRSDTLPGEQDIARVYRAGGRDTPPPKLDAQILAAARAAAQPAHPYRNRWAVPLSTAAVVVLAVGVVLFMAKEGALDHRAETDMPSEYAMTPAGPPASAPPVDVREAAPPVKAKRAAPAQSAEPAANALRRSERPKPPAAPSTADVLMKSEPAPAAAVPAQAMDRMPEAERATAVREEKMRNHSTAAGAVAMKTPGAEVTAVRAGGTPGAYEFNVTIKSPDTGCRQYADWWEVVGEDGRLLYRRVLLHSHVDEQPFTRSGGPVPIQPDTVVWVRAHMNTSGYGDTALKGSVKAGFKPVVPEVGFATGLAKQPPLPEGCDF